MTEFLKDGFKIAKQLKEIDMEPGLYKRFQEGCSRLQFPDKELPFFLQPSKNSIYNGDVFLLLKYNHAGMSTVLIHNRVFLAYIVPENYIKL